MADVHENTRFVKDDYRNELVIVLDSVFNNYFKISLMQVKHINAHNYINTGIQ